MTALARLFAENQGRTLFLPFMTTGLPTPELSAAVFEAMIQAGADGCEIGIPYADPLMDGPVVQAASDRALAAGTTIDRALGIAQEVVASTGTVGVVMTYANPVFRRGVDRFCGHLADIGAAGLIVPDVPVEESGPLVQACARHDVGLVQFVAPTSDRRRIERVAATEPGFIYAVAEMGVTGERERASAHAGRLVEVIRSVTDVPIVFGVGISTPDQAVAAAQAGADGVIVGSALVRTVIESSVADQVPAAVGGQVRSFVEALATVTSTTG